MKASRANIINVLILFLTFAAMVHIDQRPSYAACISPPAGLISWWKAEGTANDQTNVNNGSFSNGSYQTGLVGQAFSFDGASQFQAPSTGLPTGKADRSMSLWVKITQHQTGGNSYFAGYGTYAADNNMYALGALSDGRLFFTNWGQGLIGPTLDIERWHHVAVTNVGESVSLYLNGELVGTQNILLETNSGLFLAGYGAVDSKLNGFLDEIQVYNRELTPEEITSIFKADSPGGLCYSLTLTPYTLPNGSIGAGYDQSITIASGTAPYTFEISAGELPAGIVLGPGGILSGYPDKSGSYEFTILATDANLSGGSRTYSINITEPFSNAAPPVVTAPANTNNVRPTWNWTPGGGGIGIFRYQIGSEYPGAWTLENTATSFTPASDLPEGTHVLYVQEKDSNGLWTLSGSRTVVIDRTPPNTIIDSATPNNPIINAEFFSTLSISFSALGETGLTFECKYDSGGFAPCSSPASYNLITGGHTFEVRAVDLAGNIDPTPEVYQWSVVGKLVGAAYSWGLNKNGTLGNGSKDNLPHSLVSKVNGPIGFTQMAGDEFRTFAVRNDGTLWWWGGGGDVTTPAEITAITGVIHVTAGNGDAFALKSDGTVWSLANLSLPVQIPGLSGITRIDTEGLHVLALKSDGTVWVWGRNDYGGLGNGTQSTDYNSTPARVLLNDHVTPLGSIIAIAAGTFSSYAVKSDGTVWTWGWSTGGVLLSPTQVAIPGNPLIKEIAGGSYHVIALDGSGNVWGWGSNEWGQTGGSDTTDYTVTPTQVTALANIKSIAAGGPNSLALAAGNTVWSWGRNDKGQLGTGTYDYIAHFTPVKVAYLSGIEQIAVSSGFVSTTCMALKSAWVTIPIDTTETTSIQRPPNRFTSLALDSQDKVHIAYAKNHPSGGVALRYITNASGTWEDRGTIALVSNVNQASIAVDLQGTAHFSYSYYDFNISSSRLMYARYTGSGFDQTSIDTNGNYNSIVTDANNKVHISYSSAAYILGVDHKYATNESGDWVTEIINPGATSSTAYCAIGYSPAPAMIQGISMAYQRDNTLWVSTKNPTTGSWSHTQVDNTLNSGVWPSIAFDVFGLPQVSYAVGSDWKQTSAQLKYATKDTHGWRKYVVDNIETRTGLYSSIDVTKIPNASLRTVYISYFDAVNMDLKVAVVDYTTGKSSVSTIDTDGYVGEYTSLALDSKGIAHISYFSYEPLEGLKYATNSDSTGPTGTIAIRNNNTYSTSTDIALTLTCSDTFGIGCWRMQFSHDGINWGEYNPETFSASKTWSVRPGDGTKTIHARFEDAANNWSGVSQVDIFLDTAIPEGALGIISSNGFTSNRLVPLTTACSDPGGLSSSGCGSMKFSTDGLTYQPPLSYTTESSIFLPAGDGSKNVNVIYLDKAGNESIVYSASVTLDQTAPTTTPSQLSGEKTTAISVTLECTDGSGSGCASIYYTLDGYAPTVLSTRYTGPIAISGLTSQVVLKYFSVDNLGNQESYKTETYDFASGYTTLTLDIQPTLQQGELLDVAGKLTRYPDSQGTPNNGMGLSGLPIKLTITGPADSPCKDGCFEYTTTYSTLGHYRFSNLDRFAFKGSYILKADFLGTGLHQPSHSSNQSILVGASAGYAIIVQGKVNNDAGLDSHNKTTNRIYETLKERGFVDDNIMYFNYAGIMAAGVDAVPVVGTAGTENTIQWAVETWAKARMNGSPAPLYVIFVDHGNNDTFYIDPDTISSTDLNTWLTSLEGGLNTAAKREKRIIILGACYSGSFLENLKQAPTPNTNAGRIVISSAAANEQSYKGPNEPDGIRGGEFFIEELFKQLKKGFSIKAAFVEAAALTRTFTSQGSESANSVNNYNDTAVQHPLLEDDGTGAGSNTIVDGTGDGVESAALHLGFGVTNAALGPADLKAVTPTHYLPYDQDSTPTPIWLEPYGNSAVSSAWFEMKAPSKTLLAGSGSNQLALDLPTGQMTIKVSGKWEPADGEAPVFASPGKYEIYYFTKSTNAEVSEMKRSLVYRNKLNNQKPNTFNLVSPGAGGVEEQTRTELNFVWDATSDPDTNSLTYTLQIATDATFSVMAYQREEIGENWLALDKGAGLKDRTSYYWRVQAVDQYGEIRTSSQVWRFKTDDTNSLPAQIIGTVVDGLDKPVPGAVVAAVLSGSGVKAQASAASGAYAMLPAEGTYIITVTAPGFQPTQTDPFSVSSGSVYNVPKITLNADQATLRVSVNGPGRVYQNPNAAIDCISSDNTAAGCHTTAANGTPFSLIATSTDWRYLFSSWGGISCDGGSNTATICSFTLNASANVTATFGPNYQAKISTETPYASLQEALDNAAPDTTVRARDYVFQEPIMFDRLNDALVYLEGGLASDYVTPAGRSTVRGSFRVKRGTIKIRGPVDVK